MKFWHAMAQIKQKPEVLFARRAVWAAVPRMNGVKVFRSHTLQGNRQGGLDASWDYCPTPEDKNATDWLLEKREQPKAPPEPPKLLRNELLFWRAKAGESLAALAREYGISKERARKIYKAERAKEGA